MSIETALAHGLMETMGLSVQSAVKAVEALGPFIDEAVAAEHRWYQDRRLLDAVENQRELDEALAAERERIATAIHERADMYPIDGSDEAVFVYAECEGIARAEPKDRP